MIIDEAVDKLLELTPKELKEKIDEHKNKPSD